MDVIVLRPIFDNTYKGEIQVKIYMGYLHHELVLFQKGRNYFLYEPDNETEWDILGWNPSRMLLISLNLECDWKICTVKI